MREEKETLIMAEEEATKADTTRNIAAVENVAVETAAGITDAIPHGKKDPADQSSIKPDTVQSAPPGKVVPSASRVSTRIKTRKDKRQHEQQQGEAAAEDRRVKKSKPPKNPPPPRRQPVRKASVNNSTTDPGIKHRRPKVLPLPNPPIDDNLEALDEENQSCGKVTDFSDNDVVLGRGNRLTKLVGNFRFRQHVQPYRKPYRAATDPRMKHKIMLQVYTNIISGGNRFLDVISWNDDPENKEGKGVFSPVPAARALEKIAQALRESKWIPPFPWGPSLPPPQIHTDPLNEPLDPPNEPLALMLTESERLAKKAEEEDPKAHRPVEKLAKVAAALINKTTTQQSSPPLTQAFPPQEQLQKSTKDSPFKHVLLFNEDPGAIEAEEKNGDVEPEGFSAVYPVDLAAQEEQQQAEERASKKRGNARSGRSSNKRKKLDSGESSESESFTDVPETVVFKNMEPNDIIFGRFGRNNPFADHPGTVAFKRVIAQNRMIYQELGQREKRPFSVEIFNHYEGRFYEVAPSDQVYLRSPEAREDPSEVLFRRVDKERCLQRISNSLRDNRASLGAKESLDPEEEEEMTDESSRPVPSRRRIIKDLSNVVLGSRIAVYWPLDSTYYECIVERVHLDSDPDSPSFGTMLYTIKYTEDGEQEVIDLNEHEFKLVEKAKKKKKAKKVVLNEAVEEAQPKEAVVTATVTADPQIVPIMRHGQTFRIGARRTLFWQKKKTASESDDDDHDSDNSARPMEASASANSK